MDIDKVIKGLEKAKVVIEQWIPMFEQYNTPAVIDEAITLLRDRAEEIVSLLKEQESISCGEKIKAGDVVLDFYECGYCKNAIRKPWRYCPFCGKAVKWDGSDRKTLVRK